MRAYASMYKPFKPTAISGHMRLTSSHTRLISGHKKAETYHAITFLVANLFTTDLDMYYVVVLTQHSEST